MKKTLLFSLSLAISLQAAIVDGAAVKVGDKIITLYEIFKLREENKLTTEDAVEQLIKAKLEEMESEKLSISVDDIEVSTAIDDIVLKSGGTLLGLKDAIESKGMTWEGYKAQMKTRMLHDKLYKKISAQSLSSVDEVQLKEYYNANIKEFSLPESINAVQYTSKSRGMLEKMISSPLSRFEGINKEEILLKRAETDPKIFTLLGSTLENSFTPIFTVGGEFATFFIKERANLKPLPFEQTKNVIFGKIAAQKEDKVIKEYFERAKASAYIKVLRLPN